MTDFPVGCRNRHKTLCLIWHHLICGTTLYLVDRDVSNISILIYIPLCFYFIVLLMHCSFAHLFIYIPLCFYFISGQKKGGDHGYKNLHSTMLLLYLFWIVWNVPLGRHLHSTMLLLYPAGNDGFTVFTFIYIPLCFYFIRNRNLLFPAIRTDLHSTMLLLYPHIFVVFVHPLNIYIPLCFYFI